MTESPFDTKRAPISWQPGGVVAPDPRGEYVGISVRAPIRLVEVGKIRVFIAYLIAYPDSVEFALRIHYKASGRPPAKGPALDELTSVVEHPASYPDETAIERALRFGVWIDEEFVVDGGNAYMAPFGSKDEYLLMLRGSGSMYVAELVYATSRLPATRMEFVCEWPARGVELSTAKVDVTALRAAAGDSYPLWEAVKRSS